MIKAFEIARLFGIDFEIDLSWFVILALIVWSLTQYFSQVLPSCSLIFCVFVAAFSALLFFLSILLHELAHSLAGKIFDVRVTKITLFLLGGMAQFDNKEYLKSPKAEFIMAIAGPLCSLCLAGLCFALLKFLPLIWLSYVWLYVAMINFIFAAFNIIPAFPMDGGRILRAIFWQKTKNLLKSTQIVVVISKTLIPFLVIGLYLLGGLNNALWGLLIAFFIWSTAENEYRFIQTKERLRGLKVKDLMETTETPFSKSNKDIFCAPEDELLEAALKMQQLKQPSLLVADQNFIRGKIRLSKIAEYLNN
ncbi:MAG: site-2 protease family protein [Candidatus Portnoybacteria bacterium]|nr:site-2 protease family protein [Candidatus Portnoybacteria bacterium]